MKVALLESGAEFALPLTLQSLRRMWATILSHAAWFCCSDFTFLSKILSWYIFQSCKQICGMFDSSHQSITFTSWCTGWNTTNINNIDNISPPSGFQLLLHLMLYIHTPGHQADFCELKCKYFLSYNLPINLSWMTEGDILTCHSRRNTCLNNKMNIG